MRKLIFLDFDGVLNDMRYLCGLEKRRVYVKGKHSHDPMLDPERIARLNALVEETGAEVVLHTSWTFSFTLKELNGMLRRRGASFQAVAVTPKEAPKQADGERRIGDYIREWLRVHGKGVGAYAVLDDGKSADLKDGSFVHVPNGLEPRHVAKARRILS